MGEILVEIMRPKVSMELFELGEFVGPFPSGAPAIFVDTVARLGHSAGIIGGVGNDDFGKTVLDRLIRDGVDCGQVKTFAGKSTALAVVTYFADGSRKFLFYIDGTPAVMNEFDESEDIRGAKYFHIMGCSLMANECFRKNIIRTALHFKENGARLSLDPNIRPELLGDRRVLNVIGDILEKCSILFPGVDELKLISEKETVEEGVERMLEIPSMELVVLKRGKKGNTVFQRSGRLDITPYTVAEIDPTGAGDCFDAAFLCGLVENKPPEECGKYAAATGALNAAAFGPMEGRINPESVSELIKAQAHL